MDDLSRHHEPLLSKSAKPRTCDDGRQYALSADQLATYERDGCVAGITLLNDEQVDVLCEELTPLFDLEHPCHELFREFHRNESHDTRTVLFDPKQAGIGA